jgi:hypothetical protein
MAMLAEIRNEFAAVELHLDTAGNAPRLQVRDLESGAAVCLDAFLLRSLCLLPPEALEDLCRRTVPTDAPEGAGRPA